MGDRGSADRSLDRAAEGVQSATAVVAAALLLVLGLDSMRFMFGSIAWYLRDTVGIAALDLAPIALVPFLVGLILALLFVRMPLRGVLVGTVGLLAAARVANQAVDAPAPDLWAAAIATVGFVAAWSTASALGPPVTVVGLLLGLTLDTAIKAQGRSLDLSYRSGWTALVVVLVLAAVAVYLADRAASGSAPAGRVRAWPLVALGPLLFLQQLILQNPGWLAPLTRLGRDDGAVAALIITVLGVVGLALIPLGRWRLAGLLGAAAAMVPLTLAESRLFGWVVVVGIPGLAVAWAASLWPSGTGWDPAADSGTPPDPTADSRTDRGSPPRTVAADSGTPPDPTAGSGTPPDPGSPPRTTTAGTGTPPDSGSRLRTAAAAGVGLLLFVILGLLYYLTLDLELGFGQTQVRLGVVALLGALLAAAIGTRREPTEGAVTAARTPPATPGGPVWVLGGLTVVLPLLGLLVGVPTGTQPAPSAQPLRVMTYNLHSAYATDGRFDLDGIAEVIAAADADVVGLQEVPRGQLLSALTDEFGLLVARLGYPHVAFFPTTDPTWGNAVLSHFPIVTVHTTYLPQVGTPLRRGALLATLDVEGRDLLFIVTHLQHVNDPARHDEDPAADLYPVHHEQIRALLEAWGWSPDDGRPGHQPAVLVGDFNARPHWRQITELRAAGWVDAWAEVGQGPGYTSPSNDPQFRIDYVFHTPDLDPVSAEVLVSQASDHLPVVVDLGLP